MSSSSFEIRSVGMASGLVVLLELRAKFPLGIDVKNDAVGAFAVESDLCAKVLDVEITGLFGLRCGDAGGQRIGKYGGSIL